MITSKAENRKKRGRAQGNGPLRWCRGPLSIPGDDLLSPAKDYHRPWMLNGRVRNGNGWDHPGKLTEKAHEYQMAAVDVAILCTSPKRGQEEDQCGEALGC